MAPSKKVRAGLYVRISMDRTGREAGVKRQEKACRELARSKGWEVVEVFTDNDVSAYNGKHRPGWERLLRAIETRSINVVIAWANDRLYRSVEAQWKLMKAVENAGGKVVTVNDGEEDPTTAVGRMKMGILANVGEFESARKAERVRLWHEQRVANGLPHGGGKRPFGYEWNPKAGTWRFREEEVQVIRRMARHTLRGSSLSSLVNALNREGVKTAYGRRWAPTTIRKILMSPMIAGLRVHARTGTTTRGNWRAIITQTQRELLLAVFNDPMRPKRKAGPTERSKLLSGLLVCAHCGTKIYSDGQKNGRYAYACSKSWKGQGCVRVAAWPLEDSVYLMALMRFYRDFRKAKQRGEKLIPFVKSNKIETTSDEEVLVEERLRLLSRRDDLASKYAEGILDERQLKVGTARLDERIQAIEKRLSSSVQAHEGLDKEEGRRLLDAATKWPPLTPGELAFRYKFLTLLIDRIEIHRASRRGLHLADDLGRVTIRWKHWPKESLDPLAVQAVVQHRTVEVVEAALPKPA